MNAKQERETARFAEQFLRNHSYGDGDRYELKELKVEDMGNGRISIVVESGMKDDEGTMAAVLCRDRLHVFMGKRGGLTRINDKGKSVSISWWDATHWRGR
jgi:hypothetical protein